MPSTINTIFAAADLAPAGVVRWGERVPELRSGVYIVALTGGVHSLATVRDSAPISMNAVKALLARHPEAGLDGRRAEPVTLRARLAVFWLPDEVIVYIGLGTSLQRRVGQFYRTALGARGPHAGGWLLKTLDGLDDLFVHYAPCKYPDVAEDAMLRAFSAGVSAQSRARLQDPDRPIPFANLEWPKRRIKKHGIRGAKDARAHAGRVSLSQAPAQGAVTHKARDRSAALLPSYCTQRVTEGDIGRGQVRIPSPTKRLFPMEREIVEVELRGERFTCRWDPGYGSDKVRSGVLRVGKERAARLLSPEEVLGVQAVGGVVHLD